MRFDQEDLAKLEELVKRTVRNEVSQILNEFFEQERLAQISFTIEEIKEQEGVSRQTVSSWIKKGELQSIRKGGRVFIRSVDYQKFKNRRNIGKGIITTSKHQNDDCP